MTKNRKNKAVNGQAKISKPPIIDHNNKGGKNRNLVLPENLQSQILEVVKNLNLVQPIGGGSLSQQSVAPTTDRDKRKFESSSSSSSGDDSSDDEVFEEPPKRKKARNPRNEGGNASKTGEATTATTYKSQVVILEGVNTELKKHPLRLLQSLKQVKPDLQIKKGGLRITAAGHVLVEPVQPKDCNSLLKEGAFQSPCVLGEKVSARLPKAQTLQSSYQVVVKRLDVTIDEQEVEHFLRLQKIEFSGVKRIKSRERNCDTEMMRIFLKDEKTKKDLLKNGLYLDQMHFRCIKAKEDEEKKNSFQCFNCQAWNDHKTWECDREMKCVICAGSHRRKDCQKEKKDAVCANCGENHAAWSTFCPAFKAKTAKKDNTRSFATATAEKVLTPSHLDDFFQNIKLQIAVVIAQVIAKALLDHAYYEEENKKPGGKKQSTSAKIRSISKIATISMNSVTFSKNDKPLTEELVHGGVMETFQVGNTGGPNAASNSSQTKNPSTQ